jgi:hypothetical protein
MTTNNLQPDPGPRDAPRPPSGTGGARGGHYFSKEMFSKEQIFKKNRHENPVRIL